MLLRAGVGLSALVLATTPVFARAAKSSAGSSAAAQAEQIRVLQAEVEALTARLDAAENNSRAIQQAAADAQAQAAEAVAQATAATAATKDVPAQVKVALDKEPRMKPQWFDNTQVSGRMYFNFSNINQRQNGAHLAGEPNGTLNGTGFNIKRFYLGIDHTFSPIFSANLTMDVANVVGRTSNGDFNTITGTTDTTGAGCPTASKCPTSVGDAQLVGRGFYIKKAYLQAKISPALIIRAGSADLPWVPYVEGIYGYRHIENTLIDHLGFGTSADWGIHILGDLAKGLVSYQFSAVNGAGYRNIKVTKSVDFEGRVSMAYKNFFAAVGGYTGKLGNNTQRATGAPTSVTHHSATRLDALAGYKDKRFTIGGEYFYASNWSNNSLTPVTNLGHTKSDGYSVFGSFNINPKWSVFGRYDWARPDYKLTIASTAVSRKTRNTYYNVGVQWEPVKIVDLALVYKHERTTNGIIADTNGSIGGTSFGNGSYNEIGLFGQLRF
jgi:hypothetical protein